MENKLFDRMRAFFSQANDDAVDLSEALVLFEPVPPFAKRGMITVLITAAGLISITLLGGLGLVSMMVLLVTLGLIFLILSKVFGIDFDMNPSDMFGWGPGSY